MKPWTKPRRINGHSCFWFFQQTYRENIHLIWPVNDEQRKAYISRFCGIKDFSSERAAIWEGRVTEVLPADEDSPGTAQIVALRNWRNDAKGNAILAHELFHCANNILSTRGVVFSNEVDAANEAYAYLIQELVATCHAALQHKAIKG